MIIPVKPDHGHPITLIMLNHAQRNCASKSGMPSELKKCSPSYVSNVFNGKSPADDKRLRRFFRRWGNCRLKQPRPTRNDRPNPAEFEKWVKDHPPTDGVPDPTIHHGPAITAP